MNPIESIPEPDPDELEPISPGWKPPTIADFIRQMKETADKLVRDGASRGDVKLMNVAFKELRYALKIFAAYRNKRKVTVFGSARTLPSHPTYRQAAEFGRQMAERGYLTITGAGGGIMEAAHAGAGFENSLGLNIMLPFEQSANHIMSTAGERLVTLKYFFTRKLMFVKETDAVVLFPGGFGTLDEGFEVLTLVQTGKSHIFPIICVDQPGGTYWRRWEEFIRSELYDTRLISPEDLSLYRVTDSVEEAVAEVVNFHRVYHSMRFVKGDLLVRIQRSLTEKELAVVRNEFTDIVVKGEISQTAADPAEANEAHLSHMSRLRFRFDRRSIGRLRQMIDRLNGFGP